MKTVSKFSLSKVNDRTIKILLYVIFAIGTTICALYLKIPGVLDEIGTLANTSYLAGDHWINCVQSMGGFYYKYGQSFFYYPIYMIFRDHPYKLYPAILTLQMLILSFMPVISYHIARTYFKIESKLNALLISLVGVGISSIWLYSQYTRGDFMMIFLPWLLILLFLKLSTLDKENNRFKRNLFSVILAFAAVYAYMSHSRGIVMVIATIITVFFVSIFLKKHLVNYLYFIPATGIFLIIDKLLTRMFKAGTFGPYEPRHGSVDSFDMDIFMKLFTPKGLSIYLKLVIGWIFNLCTSTLGLFLIGFLAVLFITLKIIFKKSKQTLQENIMAFYVLMLILGVFFMGTLFFFPSAFRLITEIEVNRADRIIYGRYTVGVVGPMCFLAVYYLIEKKDIIIKWKSKLFSILFFGATIVAFAKLVGPYLNNVPRTNSRYFISLTALADIKHGHTTTTFTHIDKSLILTSLISIGLFAIILGLSFLKNKKLLLSIAILTLAVSFINYSVVFINVRKPRDNYLYHSVNEVTSMISEIENKAHVSKTYHNIYVSNESRYKNKNRSFLSMNVKHYQYYLGRFDLSILKYIKKEGQKEFFVIARKNGKNITIRFLNYWMHEPDAHYYTIDAFDYENAHRDIVFIKGDNLAKQIEDAGYHVTPVSYEIKQKAN